MNLPIYQRRNSVGLFLAVILLGAGLVVIHGSSARPLPLRSHLPAASRATVTVGGPQEITLLGYDEKKHRVFWVNYFHDAGVRLPQLFYIDFSTDQPSETVLDSSWREGLQLDDRSARLAIFTHVNSLKSKLQPLVTDKSDSLVLTVRIIERGDHTYARDLSPVARFEMAVSISSGGFVGATKVTAYINRRIGVKEWCWIPNERYGIATISFTGIPQEVGYSKDVVVLLES